VGGSTDDGGAASSAAVLDTCVLFPAALRDTLLRAAERQLFAGRWSEAILEELVRNLVAHGGVTPASAAALCTAIRRAFPGAVVSGYEDLIEGLTNHPKDRHVLAAAIHANARVIVTSNLRDFPSRALAPYGIEAQPPDDFLCALLDAAHEQMVELIIEQAAGLTKTPKTPEDVLSAVGLLAPRFAGRMRRLIREAAR
jgi:predicted nucleic acid-binding protein